MSEESDSCGQTELRMSPKAAAVQRIMNCMGTSGFLYRLECPATIYGTLLHRELSSISEWFKYLAPKPNLTSPSTRRVVSNMKSALVPRVIRQPPIMPSKISLAIREATH
jgi:hypothetical protein